MSVASPLPQIRPAHQSETPNIQSFSTDAARILNALRRVALRCRSAARTDLFEACAVLSQTPNVAREAYAEALIKGLGQTMERAPVFHRPEVAELSFDEAWLLRAITSAQSGDHDSFLFLLRSRVPHATRRNLGFLILAVSERFSQL